jgi:hypothetical protein
MIRKKWFWPFVGLMAYAGVWGLTVIVDAVASTPLTKMMVLEAIIQLGMKDGAIVQFQGKQYRLSNVSVSERVPGEFNINFRASPN